MLTASYIDQLYGHSKTYCCTGKQLSELVQGILMPAVL